MVIFLLTAPAKSSPEDNSTRMPVSNNFISTLSDQERAWLQKHPVIRVFQDPGWPPVEFTDSRGELSGISEDYLRLVEQRLGVKFERVQNLSWLEAYARLKRWEIDMTTSVAVTPQRTEFWAFTKPYLSIPIVIATQMDVTYIADIRELSGKKVAVVENYAIDEWLTKDFPQILRVRVKTTLEGLEMLQRGEVFAYIDNLLIIGYYQAKIKVSTIKIAGQTPYVNDQCMAVRKDWAPFAGILQKTLESISETNRNDIYRKWLPVRYEHGFNYILFWQVLGVFALILLALVFWNRKLAGEIRFRKRAEEALQESREKYRKLVDTSPYGIVLTDLEGKIIFSNPAHHEIHGYADGNLIGRYIWDLAADETHKSQAKEYYYKMIDKHILSKIYFSRNRTGGGQEIDVQINWDYTFNSKNQIEGIISIISDITKQKLLESHLQQAQKMESIGTLAGGIAHDFNNILFPIVGMAEMLLEDLPADSLEHENAQVILDAGKRGSDLVKQILAFSRQNDHKMIPIRVPQVLREVLKLGRSTIPANIQITQDIQSDCGLVVADPTQIHQIAMNLITNAYHAVEDTEGKIDVRVQEITLGGYEWKDISLQPGQYAMLSVSDNGCGIPSVAMDKIFDPYFTTKEQGKGTGLGLSVVHGIVKEYKGEIKVYSEIGKGTTFNVYLPLMEKNAQAGSVDETAIIKTGSERILLVDDEEPIAGLERQMLERLGYTVTERISSVEALRTFKENPGAFDLVITDMTMPNMTGDRLAKELVAIRKDIPVIICTGFSERINKEIAEVSGIKGFLMKPIVKSEMARVIRKVLDDGFHNT